MNSPYRILAIAIGLALSGSSSAQSAGTPGAGETSRGTASPSVTSPSRAPVASPAESASHQLKVARLSKLDGVNVYDGNAKRIGEVDDLVVDPESGRVLHALVSIGGVMGVGDKQYAVPVKDLNAFSRSADDSVPAKVSLATPVDSLTPAKKLDKDSPYVLASKLIGTNIDDGQGKEIGEIEDVLVNLQSGEVQYAMVEFEKDLASKDQLYAFKLSDFQRSKDGRKLVLDVSKDSVSQAPNIAKDRIDKVDLSESGWSQGAGKTSAGAAPSSGSTATGSPPVGNAPSPGAGPAGSSTTGGASTGGDSSRAGSKSQ